MENKYYTPEIEEFHVGFEYEYKRYDGKWIYQVFDKGHLENEFDIYDKFRVKHLDQEDIESFGWIHCGGKMSPGALQHYSKGEALMTHVENNNELNIYLEAYDYDSCMFEGIIKNKSELRKVLSMLGIENK